MLMLTQGQGHKVKGQGQICNFVKKTCFDYISWTNVWILLTHMITIDEMLKLNQGQGYKVNGQGKICNFVNNLFQLCTTNQWLDIANTYTHDWYLYK